MTGTTPNVGTIIQGDALTKLNERWMILRRPKAKEETATEIFTHNHTQTKWFLKWRRFHAEAKN